MRLFISYVHKDVEKVRSLSNLLREGGYEPWFDEQLRVGIPWQDQLYAAIQNSDGVVLALTPKWLKSEWCQWEFVRAIELGKPIIPVLIEKTKLPVIINRYQYADFIDGFGDSTRIQRFLDDLMAFSIQLPPEKAPNASDTPKGIPAQAVEQTVTIDSITRSTVNIVGQQNIETQIVGEKQRNWTLPIVLSLIIGLVTLTFGIVATLPQPQRDNVLYSIGLAPPSTTPTLTPLPTFTPIPTPTPTATPIPMMTGEWNVAVARFVSIGDESLDSGNTNLIGTVFYNRLTPAMAELSNDIDLVIQVWQPQQTGIISGNSPEERANNAERLAQSINADMIIYGTVQRDGDTLQLQPEFYIDIENYYEAEEVVGQYSFGGPIAIVGNNQNLPSQINLNRELSRRSQALALVARGLSLYFVQSYQEALTLFEQSNSDDYWPSNQGREVVYQFQGNAAARAMLLDEAENMYRSALEIEAEYARAYGGLGNVFYTRSVQNVTAEHYEPDMGGLDQAILYYHQALEAAIQPPNADIPTKAAFGLGQVYLAQWFDGVDVLGQATEQFNTVIRDYNNGENPRLQEIAAEAHARLGLISRQQGDMDTGIQEFSTAVELSTSPARRGVYWSTLADLYTGQNQLEESEIANNNAIEEYTLAIPLAAQNSWRARYWAAIATRYERLGNVNEAITALENAYSLSEEGSQDQQNYLTRLEQLR